MTTKIKNQKELDAALSSGNYDLEFTVAGEFNIDFTAAWLDISAAAALGWRAVRIITKSNILLRTAGDSQPHVEARGSSQPHVEAWGSSQLALRAAGYVQASIFGKVIGTLTANCQAMVHGKKAEVTGGHQIAVSRETAQDWCDYYGVEVVDGVATVFKGVRECYGSFHDQSFKWLPGTAPIAPAWDENECSHGLHFSPTPRHTLTHHSEAKRFLACQVRVSEMLVFFEGSYPHKCKAPAVVAPCYEVDINGKKIEQPQEKVAA